MNVWLSKHMKSPPTSIDLAIDACTALCVGEIDFESRTVDFLKRLKKSGWTDYDLQQVARGVCLEQQRLAETTKWQDETHR